MAYLGKQPEIGAYKKLDTISVVNGQAAYTMQSGSVNYSPASANHLIVSLNGIIQAPQTSYTVSGSTLTFASNLVTGDVINYILALGDVLDIGTPSDNTVTNDKLATAPTLISKGAGSDSGAIQLNCEQNSHGITIQGPPHSAGANYTLTLPNDDGSSGQALTTNGSGVLSWTTISADFSSIGEHVLPSANNTYNLGSSSYRWANVYTNDLNLSNEGSSNDVDGTWGNYTIQEGAEDLFLINKRNGKKYKFNLTEVG